MKGTLPSGISFEVDHVLGGDSHLTLENVGQTWGTSTQVTDILEFANVLQPNPEEDPQFREVLGLLQRYEDAQERRKARLADWWRAVRHVCLNGHATFELDDAVMYYDEVQGEIRQILTRLAHREWKEEPVDTRTEMGQ